MTPERWQQIKNVLQEALELAPDQRSAFLDRCCYADQSLRNEVETLLSSSDKACSSFLESSPMQVTLPPGTKLGDYEVQKLLGSGGMGEVYRARDLKLRRDVAIKVLPAFLSSDKERLRRFEQEAQAAAALNHPNILAVFQLGAYQGAPYLVSELLEGETLREQIKRGPLPARKAIDYGVQIAHGLAAAHEKGITHRDLKPENLFSTKDGRVKILDFGLAKLTQAPQVRENSSPTVNGTEPGMVMGTAGYMSPEQVRGQAVDYRTDIFAFGVVLYEMLTGKRAFHKTTAADTMSAILNQEPPAVSQITPNTPPALQRTVNRCLEKSPEQRFQSASDLAFALDALSDSAVTPLPRIGTSTTAARSRRTGIAAVITMTALILWFMWWRAEPAVPQVEGVRQLTDDGEPKIGNAVGNLRTDGLRVYFNEGQADYQKIAQVSVTGGQAAPVPMRFKYAALSDLAPDASAILIIPEDNKLWVQPLPAGEPRSLGIDGVGSFLPDRRIVYPMDDSLYIAEKDGSSPRKLTSIDGSAGNLAVSPDGKRVRLSLTSDNLHNSIWEVNSDGTGLHKVPMNELGESMGEIVGGWTRDGKYFLFQAEHGGRWDLWALPESGGVFHRFAAPVQLTNGPLSYEGPVGSREGKQIFAVGSKKRGELIRYDVNSRQFVPYLSGISAIEPRVSRDGKWIIYASYPDRSLWRSRSDGSERAQLTFPPMMVFYPEISPDGKKVAFSGLTASSGLGLYVLNMEGGTPERMVELGHGPTWSPDGNSLAFAALVSGHHLSDVGHWLEIHTIDLRTKRVSIIPGVKNLFAPWWPRPDKIVASVVDDPGLYLFDFRRQEWSQIDKRAGSDARASSSDGKYLYTLIRDSDRRELRRTRASDFRVETVANLEGLRLVVDTTLQTSGGDWLGIAADGSPALTRDVGSDEIYVLDVKWP